MRPRQVILISVKLKDRRRVDVCNVAFVWLMTSILKRGDAAVISLLHSHSFFLLDAGIGTRDCGRCASKRGDGSHFLARDYGVYITKWNEVQLPDYLELFDSIQVKFHELGKSNTLASILPRMMLKKRVTA